MAPKALISSRLRGASEALAGHYWNLPYTMPPEEAAEAVRAFQPKVVYPYHYRGSDLDVFENALKPEKIEVRRRKWY